MLTDFTTESSAFHGGEEARVCYFSVFAEGKVEVPEGLFSV
jgi:hypothetical protein